MTKRHCSNMRAARGTSSGQVGVALDAPMDGQVLERIVPVPQPAILQKGIFHLIRTIFHSPGGRIKLKSPLLSPDPIMAVMNIPKFERFFRAAASLDIDKEDLRRYDEFVNREIADLLVRGQATAKANDRDVIEPHDLPITKGLQESIHAFRALDEDIALQDVLDQLTRLPVLDMEYSDETRARLPEIAGGLSVALARSFKIVDPDLKNPMSRDWDKAFKLFDLLL
ncbi:DUF1931 family protein [Massilia sp. KIM]|uniref:DUF1931 family protein n=1 Tax=Massilia sp. KIM TaxID=1955422 RepID=UPI001C4E1932|nr:DUF1931 family protein [Massilia sp. KIM]